LLISFWTEFPVRPRERALPLGSVKRKAVSGKLGAVAASMVVLLTAYSLSLTAFAAEGGEDPIAKPVATTVARLAAKDTVTAKEYAEMASTTVTYGQRVKSAQQPPLESVVRDALQAVDAGEKADTKAADWPKLRAELEDLIKKEEPPPEDKKDEDKKDQEKKDQQQDQNQSQDQQQDQQQQQSDQQKQDQEQKEQQSQQQNKDAFGDMKDDPQKPEPKPQTPKDPGTQKVGGQQEKQPAEPVDAELAMPLQKLEQVRNQDSPAKLQQLMQGPQPKQKPTGKNW
jgi:Ca-activated chloride channel family protein